MTKGFSTSRASSPEPEWFCPGCNYNLRGISSDRCPECGLSIDHSIVSLPRIPWTRRRELGGFRAYWQTVFLVVRQPRRFAAQVQHPVDYYEARRFQRRTVTLTFLTLLCTLLCGYGFLADLAIQNAAKWPPAFAPDRIGWVLEGVVLVASAVGLWLSLYCITGVGSYFFHSSALSVRSQNRAVAMSYYACAPLGWTPISAAFLAAAVTIGSIRGSQFPIRLNALGVLALLGATSVVLQIAILWRSSLTLLRHTTHCGRARQFLFALFLPVAWVVLTALIFGGITAAAAFVSVVLFSFR